MIIALILLLAALDAAFFPALGTAARHINLTLIAALYTVIILQERMALLIYVASTLLIAFTASSAIVLPLALGLLSLALVNMLFLRFFTNRSYYTLMALGTIGWLAYHIPFDGGRLLLNALSTQGIYAPTLDSRWVISLLIGFACMLVVLTLAYMMTLFFSKRFRSYFIVTDRTL